MNINNYLKDKDINFIRNFEEKNDKQYLSLKKCWENINFKNNNNKLKFIEKIIENGIVCYQLNGKGENRREEFSHYLLDYINLGLQNKNRWLKILSISKNNKRLINTKINRINKIQLFTNKIKGIEDYYLYYKNMILFNNHISKIMSQKEDAKTIVFTTKMFGYGCRIIFKEFIKYPFDLTIPIDSRIIKIYEKETIKGNNIKDIKKYFYDLSIKYNIPQLHLDSILWIGYWNNYINKSI